MKAQCKECHAPIFTDTERAMGLCTACAYKARKGKGSSLSSPVTDKKDNKRTTSTRKNTTLKGPNTARVCARIPEQAAKMLQDKAQLAKTTPSAYLRDLILADLNAE